MKVNVLILRTLLLVAIVILAYLSLYFWWGETTNTDYANYYSARKYVSGLSLVITLCGYFYIVKKWK